MGRIECYYNLHRGCLSYREHGGRVRHADAIILNSVRLTVQPAGRERVLREKRKNVHAFARGVPAWIAGVGADLEDYTPDNMNRQGYRPVTYNPYKYDSFVYADTGERIDEARQVVLIGKRIWKVA